MCVQFDLSAGRPFLLRVDTSVPVSIMVSFSIAPVRGPARAVHCKVVSCSLTFWHTTDDGDGSNSRSKLHPLAVCSIS